MSSATVSPLDSQAAVREPQLLRFGLRQMFFYVTLLGVLCASLVATSGPWPLVICCSTLIIAAHVFGTLIGTRLCDTSHEVHRWRAADPYVESDDPVTLGQPVCLAEIDLPPTTPLAFHSPLGRWRLAIVLGGILAGATVGLGGIVAVLGADVKWPGLIVGGVSSAVLGGWTAFLASNFGRVSHHAWRHANEEERRG